jgi:perosamine synthetase
MTIDASQSRYVAEVVARIRAALANPTQNVALHEPTFTGREWDYVKECLDSGWVSSVGKFVDRFEQDLCKTTGARHAIAVVNGTAALHVCLLLADVRAGDEVLLPALTFVATANAVRYCNAIPHFVDVEERTLGVCASSLRRHLDMVAEMRGGDCYNRHSGRRIRAVLPMHAFGHPCDLAGLLEVAKQFGLQCIEDAAESLGSLYHGRHTGNFGLVAALSFNGNKVVTTGGGGAILTNDQALAKLAKHLTTTAKLPHPWRFDHDMVGYNYRMPNINAALGCAQLESLPLAIARKRALFNRYSESFATLEGVRVLSEPEQTRSNYWLQTLVFDESHVSARDDILAATNATGLMTRPPWTPMHLLAPFVDCPRMSLPVTEAMQNRLLNIPSSPQLMDGVVIP